MDIPKRFYDHNYLPSIDEVIEYYFSLNPNGDPQSTLSNLAHNLQLQKPTSEDQSVIVSFGYIIEKYKKYNEWWKGEFSSKDEKYIARDDKLRSPSGFIAGSYYNHIYSKSRTARDDYLFSKLPFNTLRDKLKIFKSIIGDDNISVEEEKPIAKPKNNNYVSDESPF